MRYVFATMAAAGLAFSGCSAYHSDHGVNPRGDYPDVKTGNITSTGTLVFEGLPAGRAETEVRSRLAPPDLYSVYDVDGRLVTRAQTPDVELPAGRYLVRMKNDEAHSPFWVTIEQGRRTVVDLDHVNESDHYRLDAR